MVDTLNQFYHITIFLLALSVTERSIARDQPRLIQGIQSGDGVGEHQETTA